MFCHWTILHSVIIYIVLIQMSLKLRILLIFKSLLLTLTFTLKTNIYDKRDDFIFPMVNFPFITRNIPTSPVYGVYILQLVRYSRACARYSDFLDRAQLLTLKLTLWEHLPFFRVVRVAHLFSFMCCHIMCLNVLSSMLWYPLPFPRRDNVRFAFTASYL